MYKMYVEVHTYIGYIIYFKKIYACTYTCIEFWNF